MGVKAVYGILVMSLIASILYGVALLLPMHRMNFFGGWFWHLATMETHATFIQFPVGRSRFCKTMYDAGEEGNKAKGSITEERFQSKGWCEKLEGAHEIQDVAMVMCAPAISVIWPDFCSGLNLAYVMGVVVVIVVVTNAVCQVVGCFLLYDYITRKANPQYRFYGISILAIGGVAMFCVTMIYGTWVLGGLDTVGGSSFTAGLLTTSRNHGYGPGYVLLCCGCAFTFFSALWTPFVEKEFEETSYLEDKAEKFETQMYGTMEKEIGKGQHLMPPGPMMNTSQMMQPGGVIQTQVPIPMGMQMMGGGGGGMVSAMMTQPYMGGPAMAYQQSGPTRPLEQNRGAF